MNSHPDQDIQDTYTQFLSQVPQDIQDRFPQTVSYLRGLAQQQERDLARQRASCRHAQVMRSVIARMDVGSPTHLLAAAEFFKEWAEPQMTALLDTDSMARFEQQAQQVSTLSAPEVEPTPVSPPGSLKGVEHLVELFQEKAIEQLRAFQGPESSVSFGYVSSVLDAWRGLFTWKNVHVRNIVGHSMKATLAANILNTLAVDPSSSYIVNRLSDGKKLADQIREELARHALAQEIMRLDPSRAHEALALLRSQKLPSPAQRTKKGP